MASDPLSIVLSILSGFIINKVFTLKIIRLLALAAQAITASRGKRGLINISIGGISISGEEKKLLIYFNVYIIKYFIKKPCSFFSIRFTGLLLFLSLLLALVYICDNKVSK